MSSVHLDGPALSSKQPPSDDGSAAIRALVSPPTACPCCLIERGEYWPGRQYSTRICPRHDAELRARSRALNQRPEGQR